jgi:hypothetical protein
MTGSSAGKVVARAASARFLALSFRMYSHTNTPRAIKAAQTTGMAILAPKGKSLPPDGGGISPYFCEKTWSVIKVSPATVGVEAGTYVVAGTE